MDDRFRASDADRDRVTGALREHYAAGRLSADELHERLTMALGARTLGELNGVLRDLPGPVRVPQPGGWRPPQAPPVWMTARRRRRPHIAPLVLIVALFALVVPGAGGVLFAVLQAVLLVMLLAVLGGMIFAARFIRRARREFGSWSP